VEIIEEDPFKFGDADCGVSAELDRARREAAFKILCIVRFVRIGINPPPAGGQLLLQQPFQ